MSDAGTHDERADSLYTMVMSGEAPRRLRNMAAKIWGGGTRFGGGDARWLEHLADELDGLARERAT